MNDNRSGGEGLQRKLSPLNVWALALGSIIGWGAFVMPANTFLPNAGPLGTLIAMAAGAIIMVVIALNYSYMINHFPVAGGEFTFTNASFGPTCGFLCAWFLGLSYLAIVPLNATALALIGRNLFPNLTQWGYLYSVEGYSIYAGEILLAIIALALFAVFSIRGCQRGWQVPDCPSAFSGWLCVPAGDCCAVQPACFRFPFGARIYHRCHR